MDDVSYFGLWAQGTRCYQQLLAIADMNDSGTWAEDSLCYE